MNYEVDAYLGSQHGPRTSFQSVRKIHKYTEQWNKRLKLRMLTEHSNEFSTYYDSQLCHPTFLMANTVMSAFEAKHQKKTNKLTCSANENTLTFKSDS